MKKLAMLLCASVLLGWPWQAYASFSGVEEHYAGNTPYVTGGVGFEERTALKSVENKYNVKLTFALASGAYVSDVDILIHDAQGNVVLQTQAQGPFLYTNLSPGTYTVEAVYNGKIKKSTIEVNGKGQKTVLLHWPQDMTS